jgi:hypothetical protein
MCAHVFCLRALCAWGISVCCVSQVVCALFVCVCDSTFGCSLVLPSESIVIYFSVGVLCLAKSWLLTVMLFSSVLS